MASRSPPGPTRRGITAADLGSRSYIGTLGEDEIDRITGRDTGKPLRAALAEAGFACRPRTRVEPGRYVGYLEAHIEQGDTADTTGMRIGVVETIVGIRYFREIQIARIAPVSPQLILSHIAERVLGLPKSY